MERMVRTFSILLLLGGLGMGQAIAQKGADTPQILFTVAGTPVEVEEFIYVYTKNNQNNPKANTRADIDEYLRLFMHFKLKVKEGQALGMDTTRAFLKEFEQYRDQLAAPYFQDEANEEQLVREAYDRLQWEVRASHLLLNLPEQEQDTAQVYQRLMEWRQRALSGEDFGTLAMQYSQDPSVKQNRGDLGYFSALQMVYPFETAAFQTPVGEVSLPVRTRFGYHLIQVTDKRPARGQVEVSHIMLRHQPGDSTKVKNAILDVYDQLLGGFDWEELCAQYSEDINSRDKGGRIPPFGTGAMPAAFEEAAFSLQEPGDFSGPIMTPYGWHLVRLERNYPLLAFENIAPNLRAAIKRDARGDMGKKKIEERLKAKHSYREEPDAVALALSMANSSLTDGSWNMPSSQVHFNRPLFYVGQKARTVGQFLEHVVTHQRKVAQMEPKIYMRQLLDEYAWKELMEEEKNRLEREKPEFRWLVKEYREGIVLFELMDKQVWARASEDSLGLAAYYEKNKGKYLSDQTYEMRMLVSQKAELLDKLATLPLGFLASDSLLSVLPAEGFEVEPTVWKRQEELAKVPGFEGKTGAYRFQVGNKAYLAIVSQVQAARPLLLSEARGAVMADYQNQLEADWVAVLKKKYPLKVNKKSLKNVYQKLEKAP
jgi:peptidyl-prolyl cis-trans isomerase SurA